MKYSIHIDVKDILFGLYDTSYLQNCLNYCITIAKYFISIKKKSYVFNICLYDFLAFLKQTLHTKYMYYCNKGLNECFNKKWGLVYDSI